MHSSSPTEPARGRGGEGAWGGRVGPAAVMKDGVTARLSTIGHSGKPLPFCFTSQGWPLAEKLAPSLS